MRSYSLQYLCYYRAHPNLFLYLPIPSEMSELWNFSIYTYLILGNRSISIPKVNVSVRLHHHTLLYLVVTMSTDSFNIKSCKFLHTICLRVPYDFQDEQQLFPYTNISNESTPCFYEVQIESLYTMQIILVITVFAIMFHQTVRKTQGSEGM